MKMNRLRKDDLGGTTTSAVIWSVIALVFIFLLVPGGLYVANGLGNVSSTETFYSPSKVGDMNNETYFDDYKKDVTFEYTNSTSSTITTDQVCYYSDETPNNYNEILIEQSTDDNGTIDTAESEELTFNMNISASKLINEPLKKIKFSIGLERNGTAKASLIALGGDGTSSEKSYTIVSNKEYSLKDNMTTYEMDISYTELLQADNTIGDMDQERLVLELTNTSGGLYQAGDGIQWNVQLLKEKGVSTHNILTIFSGALGIAMFPIGLFMTDLLDLKDFTDW